MSDRFAVPRLHSLSRGSASNPPFLRSAADVRIEGPAVAPAHVEELTLPNLCPGKQSAYQNMNIYRDLSDASCGKCHALPHIPLVPDDKPWNFAACVFPGIKI